MRTLEEHTRKDFLGDWGTLPGDPGPGLREKRVTVKPVPLVLIPETGSFKRDTGSGMINETTFASYILNRKRVIRNFLNI